MYCVTRFPVAGLWVKLDGAEIQSSAWATVAEAIKVPNDVKIKM